MSQTLEAMLERGRQYAAMCERIKNVIRYSEETRESMSAIALRKHSEAMRDLSLEDAEALLAALIGAVKWHERQEHGGAYYLCAARDHLQVAANSLADRWDEVEAACEAPPERLSGEQLGLRAC